MSTAIDYWSPCSGYGTTIPPFQVGGSGGIPIAVTKVIGKSTAPGGGCGLAETHAEGGQLQSAEITVWTQQIDGASCEPVTDSLAHELGHALGLANADATACLGHIMGPRAPGGTRTVSADDCDMADTMWMTTTESQGGSDPSCDAYCWTSCVNGSCPQNPNGDPCPILLDLENDGFRLTGLDDPVWFDIDADGDEDLISWTNRGEGILARDRNGNGRIDDGGELFGNYTLLADGSRALNGYLALAELDSWQLGGNEDGSIDPTDAGFHDLKLWTDRNHDGVSQGEELQTLGEAGILRLGLDYTRSNRTDRYGNEFRFLGRAWKSGPHGVAQPIQTWDVFFMVVP